MNIYVDFSIFIKDGQSLGHVSGELEVLVEPRVGELLELPRESNLQEDIGIPLALEVEAIIQSDSEAGSNVQVALKSVTLDRAPLLSVMDKVVEEQMGLIWTPHDII